MTETTKGRALYNLIRMSWLEDPSIPVEAWQVEDYRPAATTALFLRLQQLGISIDEERFCLYAEESASPEDLADTLWVDDEDLTHFEQAYLLIFELWRRLLPDRLSLSLFCDEFDHLVDLHDVGELEEPELIQSTLHELREILDAHVDQGSTPREIFAEVSLYCAHDLESFIYDFASEQIDNEETLDASELVDGFLPYVADCRWFEFLQLRLLSWAASEEADPLLTQILEECREHPEFELLFEMALFLMNREAPSPFLQTIKQCCSALETEGDFQDILALTAQFYHLLDREEEVEKVTSLLNDREKYPIEQELSPNDLALQSFCKLIEHLERSEA